MKKAETAPKKLLLLSLIPTLALGAVEVASQIRVPAPIVSMDEAPDVIPYDSNACDHCVMAA